MRKSKQGFFFCSWNDFVEESFDNFLDNQGPHLQHECNYLSYEKNQAKELESFKYVLDLHKKPRTKIQMLKEEKHFNNFIYFEEEFVNPD